MTYHDNDTCLRHCGLQTWACPDCILEAEQDDVESLPASEYLHRPTPIEVLSGMRAEGDPDGK